MEALNIIFVRRKDDKNIYKKDYLNSWQHIVLNSNNFIPSLELSQREIINRVGNWLSESSGWTIERIDGHFVDIANYQSLHTYVYIPLPAELQHPKKGLINIKNNDNECFRWCHIRHLNPKDNNPQRIKRSDILMVDQLNYYGVEFPVSVKDYAKIEAQNSININVWGYENKEFYPIYVSKQNNDDMLNLLLITEGEKTHYVLIKE